MTSSSGYSPVTVWMKIALGQAQRVVGERADELRRRQDLAARDAVDVGDDALDLGDLMLPQPALHVVHADSLASARARQAAPKAANRRLEIGCSSTRHSGCHWTPSAKPGASVPRAPPRSCRRARCASTASRGGQPVDRLAVQRVDLDPLRAAEQRLQPAARGQDHLVRRPVALLRRQRLVRAVIEPAGQPRARPGAASRRAPRSAPATPRQIASSGTARAIARRISGRVVASRAGSLALPAGAAGPP